MKKYFILLIIFSLLLISTVSASDNNMSDNNMEFSSSIPIDDNSLNYYCDEDNGDELSSFNEINNDSLNYYCDEDNGDELSSFSEINENENNLSINSFEEKISSSQSLIVNPSFDDGLNGWNSSGDVSLNDEGLDGPSVTLGANSYITQDINLTNINQINFWYKATTKGYLAIFLNEFNVFSSKIKTVNQWFCFEKNTTSYDGIYTLKIHSSTDGVFLIDNVTYVSNSSNSETIEPLIVNPNLVIVSIGDVVEGSDVLVDVIANETFSGVVKVLIGGSQVATINVVNGRGNVTVASGNFTVGSNTVKVTSDASELFTAGEAETTFNVTAKPAPVVTPVATSVSAPKVTTTYATSKNIVVTLKDTKDNLLAGKYVTIVLNGVSKTVKTNDKGQATLAIGTNLAPKTYAATITFAGDSNYAKSTGSVKVVVNKASSKLTAAKKTFKVKTKTKKYTITLKSDKGKAINKVKVTLKVKGKVYTAKTNSKGKATFKITKLTKKGTFKAVVKFSGNKYYKALSKTVKLIIKK